MDGSSHNESEKRHVDGPQGDGDENDCEHVDEAQGVDDENESEHVDEAQEDHEALEYKVLESMDGFNWAKPYRRDPVFRSIYTNYGHHQSPKRMDTP